MKGLNARPVSRREFMRLSALATAGALAVACAPGGAPAPAAPAAPAAQAPAAAAPAAAPGKFNEAPMLADLVKAGKLPALDERLPATPGVIDGAEGVGNYGGTFRRAFKGVSDRWGPTKMQDRGLAWYDKELNIRARMAESWEVNQDATEWTFHLRKGLKWSDGQPFTTESVKYWYDNELQNKALLDPYSTGTTWKTGAKNTLLTLEVIDDYTFKFKFADPNPLFIFKVTRPTPTPYSPGHYMKQFHIDLTDDKAGLDAKIKAAGFDSWDKYYVDRGFWFFNPERPSVAPWLAKNPVSQELFLMERNPYFFAVDNAGNQLPYVDKVTHRLFSQPDVLNLWVTNGEIDFQARHMALSNFTLYKENEAKGDYKVLVGTSANHMALQPNQTTKNKPFREFFNNRDVRIALSIAIDRAAINELVFDGLAVPRQYSPLSTSPQAYDKQANAHIEYDVKKANELLDGAGYKLGADGVRQWKDGSGPVSFIIEGTAVPGDADEDAVQQVVKYLAAVGVKASYKGVERSLYEQHWRVNEIEAAWWGGDRTVLPIVAPWIFLGTQTDRPWADAWSLWKNNGTADPNAEEPPADHWISKIWAIWEQIAAEPDSDKRTASFKQILDIWAEEIPMIGVLGEIPAPVIVKNGVHNFLDGMPIDDTTGDEQILNSETYFWDDPAKHV